MRTSEIVALLDTEFRVHDVGDRYLAKHALTDRSRAHATEAFLSEKSGLMFDFSDTAGKAYCVVFTTPEVFDRLLLVADAPCLLFTHHPHDYNEDASGFGPFPGDYLDEFERREIAVYAIHAPLDVGLNICVSKSLAQRLSLSDPVPFCEACGGHLGVMGSLAASDLAEMAAHVRGSLGIDSVDIFDYGAQPGLVAVVAGGGDQAGILERAEDLGCATYITGTAVHRWERAGEGNEKFHALARRSGINVIGASHYHTEKCAVQDVAVWLEKNGLQAEFLEDPVLEDYSVGNWRE